VLLLWMAMTATLWQAPSDTAPNKVSIRNNEIWVQTASAERQLTHDGIPKRLPAVSPSGDAVIYAVDHPIPLNPPEETIVVIAMDGKIRQTIIPRGYVPAAFDRLEWLDDHRIGAMSCGHANCMYWVIDAGSGKTFDVMSGGFDFIWSHNRQFVARLSVAYWCDDNAPQGQPCPEHDAVLFNRDDAYVYPPEMLDPHADETRSHEIGTEENPRFVWSPDDKYVAFTDVIGPEDDWYVVLVSPSGQMLRDTVPIDLDYDAKLEWLNSTHLDLRAGKRVFHFAVQGKQFSQIRQTD
jgi:hypothetical protein